MSASSTRPADTYSPLYFLGSLGAGGLAAAFFMFLFFWVPHPAQPVPVFEDIAKAFVGGSFALKAGIIIAEIMIAILAFMNIKYLLWNLRSLAAFRKTEAFETLKNSNGETTILAMPLALAMTINVGFIVGMVFVPGLWSVVEYLFPLALIAFAAVGYIAFRYIGDFLGRVLVQGGVFDVTSHNSFAQLLPAFALSMVAVGLSAPSALSNIPVVAGISLILSTIVGFAAIIYALFAAITAFNSMLHYGTSKESAPTLMVVIPIITVLSIMFLRQEHGLHVNWDVHSGAGETMTFLSRMLTVQIVFLALGLLVLAREEYFKDFVFGSKTSPGSYALVCPGVALSVMLHFFTNKGLVAAGLITKFGVAYWVFSGIAIVLAVAMVLLVLRLNRQHFGRPSDLAAVPAE